MGNALDFEIVRIFNDIFKRLHIEGYLVGGAVRDIILRVDPIDFDFTAVLKEDEHLKKTEEISSILGCSFKYNSHYHTAKFQYKGNDIDFVMARDESYPQIASRPIVHSSGIIKDIMRRDFTINSAAMKMGENFGIIIDPAGGRYDMEKGIIRVLHGESFRDDPTRLFRGIKYASRFNFVIENETLELMKDCLHKNYLSFLSPQRIIQELYRIFEDSNVKGSMNIFKDLRIFDYIAESKIDINMCYNENKFKLLPNRKKLLVLLYKNDLEAVKGLRDSLRLGDDFVEDIIKIKLLKSMLHGEDKLIYRFLFLNQNSIDSEVLMTIFSEDCRIYNFNKYREKVKMPVNEIKNIENENRQEYVINWKIEKLIKLAGGH